MTTVSFCTVITTAEDSNNVTANTSQTIDSTGFWYPTPGRFTYNDGSVQGSYVYFTIDENTGVITDYTVKLTIYPMNIYSPISSKSPYPEYIQEYNISYENKTIFTSIQINAFERAATPTAFADYLIFLGKNTFMKCIDQEGGNLHFASSDTNTKIIFEVADGSDITQFYDDFYSILPVLDVNTSGSGESGTPEQPPVIDSGSSPWQTVYVKSDNITASINIYNGTITINGDTIEVNLSAYGYLDVYTWVDYPMPEAMNDFWYSDLNIQPQETIIEDAKNNGIITAEGWYTTSDTNQPEKPQLPNSNAGSAEAANQNFFKYNDPTFEMSFNQIDQNGVDVVVDSQIPTGRIVIINVDKATLQNTSIEQLLVKMDDTQINPTETLQDLMEKAEMKDSQAGYYALAGEHLTTVFVYVPHFSTHTISIKSLTSGVAAISNVILPIILSALFICLSIGAIILQKRKQRDDF